MSRPQSPLLHQLRHQPMHQPERVQRAGKPQGRDRLPWRCRATRRRQLHSRPSCLRRRCCHRRRRHQCSLHRRRRHRRRRHRRRRRGRHRHRTSRRCRRARRRTALRYFAAETAATAGCISEARE